MNSQPLVSVVIPAHNNANYIGEAIESVLQQSYQAIELIVIDDGSTDETAQIVQQFGSALTYRFQPQRGVSSARNRGAELAQGKYLAFLDADDLWVKEKISWQVQALTEDPTLAMVFGQVEQFYSPELVHLPHPELGNRRHLAGIYAGAMLIRRNAFFQTGSFDPSWTTAEFLEWFSRTATIGLKAYVLPQLVTKRRIHTQNTSIRHSQQIRRGYLHLVKMRLDERRLMAKVGSR